MVTNVDVGVDGYAAMQQVVATEVSNYPGVGAFVESIADVRAPRGTFWALSIDGERATMGISEVVVDREMSIEWNLVRIDD